MSTSQARLYKLEGLFVREFRACQTLLDLSQEERSALSRDDVSCLPHLTVQKEDILDELAELESAKFSALHHLGITSDPATTNVQKLKLVDFLTAVDRETASRLLHIQEGTLVLIERIREITLVNRALVVSALQRASSMQAYLLSAYRLPLTARHEPLRSADATLRQSNMANSIEITNFSKGQMALPAIFAAIITARDALNTDNSVVLSSAVDDLQIALEEMAGYLEIDESTPQIEALKERITESLEASRKSMNDRGSASLVEMIASLYQQENAYQASLKTSNRMLALV